MTDDASQRRTRRQDGSPLDQTVDDDVGHVPSGIPSRRLEALRAAIAAHRDEGLSEHASRLLLELCVGARSDGVPPEQLIAELKRQMETIRFANDDPLRRRKRVAQAVTTCIHAYYSVPGRDGPPGA